MIEQEKVRQFSKWCDDKGIIRPKMEWPVPFGTPEYPYQGIGATADINHRENYIAVPYNAIMTHEKARKVILTHRDGKQTRSFGSVMDENPEIFDPK